MTYDQEKIEKIREPLDKLKDKEPAWDIAICSDCGWRGDINECGTEQEGDWENGYYEIHTCPKCEDGGLIEEYSMSDERAEEWNEWYERKKGHAPDCKVGEVTG